MATTALSYMKNVAKSFGYAFQDNFNEMNPTVAALFRETKDLKDDLYQSIDNFKAKIANPDSSIRSEINDTTKELWANLTSDLRTGKWYNKARKEKAQDAAMSAMFGGIDFDDFGDFDSGFDDADSDLDEQAAIQEDSTKAMAQAMDVVGGKTAAAISAATVNSANYIVQSSRMNTRALYTNMNYGFNQVSTGLAAVNSNISTIVKLGEPLTKHMQNSAVFYSRSNEYQEKALKLLEKIAENTSPRTGTKKKPNEKLTMNDMFTSEGMISVDALKQYAKQTLDESPVGMLRSMLGMFGGIDGLKGQVTGSPLALVLPWITGQIFNVKGSKGISMRDTMKNFNKALSGMFTGGVARLQDTRFGTGLLGDIGRALQSALPKSGVKNKFDPKNYEKGPVDWDGKSRMALMNVIPTQLAQILAAITGKEEMRFDYNNGKWIKVSTIRQMRQKRMNSAGNEAGGEILQALKNSITNSGMSDSTKAGYNKELTAFFAKLVQSDNTDFLHILDADFNLEAYKDVISPVVFKDMQRRLRAIRRARPHDYSQLARNTYAARARYGRQSMDEDSMEVQLDNGSIGGAGASGIKAKRPRIRSERQRYTEWRRAYKGLAQTIDFDTWRRNPLFQMSISPYADQPLMVGSPLNMGSAPMIDAGRSVMDQVDQYGKNNLFYLNGIYQYTGYIAKNLKYLVPGREAGNGNRIILEAPPVVQLSNNTVEAIDRVQVNLQNGSNDQYDRNRMAAEIEANAREELNFKSNISRNINKLSREDREYYIRAQEDLSLQNTDKYREIAQRLANLDRLSGNVNRATGTISNKVKNAIGRNKFIQNAQETLGITSDEFSNIFDAVTETINGMVYGKDEHGVSIMDSVKTGVKDIFNTLTLHIADYIPGPVKDFFNSLWNSGPIKNFRQQTKDSLMSMLGWFIGGNEDQTSDGATGSGLIKYINTENRIAKNYRHNRKYFGVGGGASAVPRPAPNTNRDIRETTRERHTNAPSQDEDSEEDADPDPASKQEMARRTINKAATKIANRVVEGLTDLIGKEKPEDERKKIRGNIEGLMKDVAGAKGAMGAGALVGAGTSLITGAFLGPIAGAAIGASVGFLTKSKTAQNVLFGEEVEDENGNKSRAGGVLGKEATEFIYKHVPSMAKGAGIGMTGGLFLGSPVLGAILGSTVGFVSSSERAKSFIFGKMGEDGKREGGLIKKELQEQVKKAFPRMGAGAIAGMIAGPFSLPMNIILGSALGFASTTDKWKEMMFGRDENGNINKKMGQGGFTGKIKKDLFDPIIGIFDKLSNRMRDDFKSLTVSIGKRIRRWILRRAGGKIANRFKNSRVGRRIGKVAKGIGNFGWNVLTGPGRFINNSLEKSDLRKGYTYGDLTAEERENRRAELGLGGSAVDQLIMANRGNLGELQEAVAGAIDPTKVRDKRMIAGKRTMFTQMNDITDSVLANADLNGDINGELYNKFIRDLNKKGSTGLYTGEELWDKLAGKKKYRGLFENGNGQALLDKQKQLTKLIDDQNKNLNYTGYATDAQNTLKTMITNAGLSDKLLDKNGNVKLKDKQLIRMLSQLGIDVKAEEGSADAREEEENKQNEKKKTETIIDKIPQHLTDIFDTLRTGFDDLIQVLTVKDPNQVSDIVNRHHNKIKAKNDEHRAEEQSKAAKEMEEATKFNGYGYNAGGGDEYEIGPDEILPAGKGSGLYRKLRRYGIGASGLLDDDQSEDEKNEDVDTDSPGEDSTVRGQYGNIQDNNASTEVREKKKERKGFFSAISNVPVISSGVSKLVGIANAIYDKLVGDGKEKKESLFSKLFKIITTIGGALLSFVTGGLDISGIIKTIVGGGTAWQVAKNGIDKLKDKAKQLFNWGSDTATDTAGADAGAAESADGGALPADQVNLGLVFKTLGSAFATQEVTSGVKTIWNDITGKTTDTKSKLINQFDKLYPEYLKENPDGNFQDFMSRYKINTSTGQLEKDVPFWKSFVSSKYTDRDKVFESALLEHAAKKGYKLGGMYGNIQEKYFGNAETATESSQQSSSNDSIKDKIDSIVNRGTLSDSKDTKIDNSKLPFGDVANLNPIESLTAGLTAVTSGLSQLAGGSSGLQPLHEGGGASAIDLRKAAKTILGLSKHNNNDNSYNTDTESDYSNINRKMRSAVGMDEISKHITSSFNKQVDYMQRASLRGDVESVWRADIGIDRTSSKGLVKPLIATMFDLTKTAYAMLATFTGVLTPMNASIAGVQSGLEYITGVKSDTYDKKAQQANEVKANDFGSKAKSVFGKISRSLKSFFNSNTSSTTGGSRSNSGGTSNTTTTTDSDSEDTGASGSGLLPLYGIGGGRTVKDTKGKKTKKSLSKPSAKSANYNLDYAGNDADHSFIDQIWSYLKSLGLNDGAAAGILGNIRAESGGDFAPYRVQYRFSDKIKSELPDLKKKYEGWGVDFSNYQTVDKTLTQNVDNGNISLGWFMKPRGEGTQDGYGISQFTFAPYKEQLYKHAKEKKTSVGNLAAQLDVLMEQLKASGVYDTASKKDATAYQVAEDMLLKYEKPDNASSMIGLRTGYAEEIYNKYKGKNPNTLPVYGKAGKAGGNYAGLTDDTSSDSLGGSNNKNSDGDSTGSTTATETDKQSTIIEQIISIFRNAFTRMFGGQTPSGTTSGISSTGGTSSSSNSGSSESGDASSDNPFKGMKNQPYQIMQGWKGKLVYSQQARDPHHGSADCSSSVQAAILDAGGPDVGGWTNPQSLNTSTMDIVKRDTGGIGSGDIKLVPNDVLLYQSNYSMKDTSKYPYGIGHAAMYVGDGKMIEQTSKGDGSKGTYESNMRYDKLVQVSRVKPSKVKGSKADDEDDGGSSSGLGAGASGFVSQLDSKYKGLSVGGKSMVDNGCGPASAVMALGSMGKGTSVGSAAALANQYQTKGGTDAAYFKDIFNRNGVSSSYVTGNSVKRAVASGNPVVLMGQDKTNTSKRRSPFGPRNHYVVAEGIDSNGNVNIADPESNSMHKYSSSILNKVKVGVAAKGTGGLSGPLGFGGGKSKKKSSSSKKKNTTKNTTAKSNKDNGDRKKVIWDFLRSKVGLTEAGTAGVMGCWEQESGNKPNTVEGFYINGYPGDDKVFGNAPQSLDEYAKNFLFPAYSRSGISVNQGAYKMDGEYDGYYAPGLGLAQWTGPRTSHLLAYAKKHGDDWRTLKGQLDFFVNGPGEFKSNTAYGLLKKANSVSEAVANFYKHFEMGGQSIPSGDVRFSHGQNIYNKYKGTGVTTDLSSFTDGDYASGGSDGTSTGTKKGESDQSSDTSGMTTIQKIITIFSDAFNAVLSGKEYTGSDFSSGSVSGSSYTGGPIEGGIGASDGSLSGAMIDYAISINNQMLEDQKTLPEKDKWHYGNGCAKTFERARKKGIHRCQCDTGCCWLCRHFGLISNNESFNTADATGLPSVWNKLKKEGHEVHIHPNQSVESLMKQGKLKGPTVFRTRGHAFMYLGDYKGHSYWWDSGHKSQGMKAGAKFGDAHKGGWVYKTKQGGCINSGNNVIAYCNFSPSLAKKNVTAGSAINEAAEKPKADTTKVGADTSKKNNSSKKNNGSKKKKNKGGSGSGLYDYSSDKITYINDYINKKSAASRSNSGGASSIIDRNLIYKPSKAGNKVLRDTSNIYSIYNSGGGASGSKNKTKSRTKSVTYDRPTVQIKRTNNIPLSFNDTDDSDYYDSNASTIVDKNINIQNPSTKYGMSKETAAMLKVIIALVEKLISNTDKVDNIYSILNTYCKNTGNSELSNAVSDLGSKSSGSKKKKKNSKFVPRDTNSQNTIDSLADLKEICDMILIG